MPIRFQRRIKILPGLRLNVSKTGISWTVGARGTSVTARDGKLTSNLGLPGTGLAYRKRLNREDAETEKPERSVSQSSSGPPFWLLLVVVLCVGIFIGLAVG
jgi:hypothetical protein